MIRRAALAVSLLASCTTDSATDVSAHAVEGDVDNDGIPDEVERRGWSITVDGRTVFVSSDPKVRDTDGDRIDDGDEYYGWTLEALDVRRAVKSNPASRDTDGDGVSDRTERDEHSDPSRVQSFAAFYEDSTRHWYRKAVEASRGIPRAAIELGQAEAVTVASFSHVYPDVGVLPYEVHFLQPDAGEAVTIEIAAYDAGGRYEIRNVIRDVSVLERPGGRERTLHFSDGFGRATLSIPSAAQGMSMLRFSYDARVGGRTLRVRARDAAGNAVPIVFERPPVVSALDLTLELGVPKGASANWNGGAPGARIRDVRIDGALVHDDVYSGGPFSFPLGELPAGTHTLTAHYDYSPSSQSSQQYESVSSQVCCISVYSWNDVTFIHEDGMKTLDYDAWQGGAAYNEQTRPVPIRRTTTMTVLVDNKTLGTNNATIEIFKKGSNVALGWTKTKITEMSIWRWVAGSQQTTVREKWTVAVPAGVAVGSYELKASVNGTLIQTVPFYVLFDVYDQIAGDTLTTYGYDETTAGTDDGRDDYAAFYVGNQQLTYRLRAFSRASSSDRSMLSLAMAIVDGQTSEVEAARRLHRVVGQRVSWQGNSGYDDVAEVFNTGPSFTTTFATSLADQGVYAPYAQKVWGECSTTAMAMTGLARAIGLGARPVTVEDAGEFNGYHVWAEVRVPLGVLPLQGGKTSSGGITNSDNDPWIVFDPLLTEYGGYALWGLNMPAVAPPANYGRALYRTTNNWASVPPRINPTNWDPSVTYAAWPATSPPYDVGARYAWDHFWINPGTSVNGILGWGEKDIFSVKVAAGTTRTLTVTSAEPWLTPRLTYNALSAAAPVPQPALGGTNTVTLGPGDWELIVYPDEHIDCDDDEPCYLARGDSIKYTVSSN